MKFEIGEFVQVVNPLDDEADIYMGEIGKIVYVPKDDSKDEEKLYSVMFDSFEDSFEFYEEELLAFEEVY